MHGARREWLERLERAAHRALADVAESDDAVVRALRSDLEELAARLRRELEGRGQDEPRPSGIR